ncbi:hypothetical protein SPRG_19281 [Saprolegnia parasitica CBS 223.65]|uniref:FCP1 homology domain-containing protein n=1 Tax=Saprolegnia parasitica (strain CBS 223.65) TaxID=695850 RepID=A0A067CWS8_SAPPC|nr:hypothetical protein SPRG_19281 [Saprolegnia parasitica CBS 223.65]KDO33670.1 hypothetical protein SPRG_19281 [Saprolegnia parasitica CBS 223.65]|eukprot:XP_012195698.1 hypothetical protein SPRG_19281 [Saprolegnia parasitica CBS 223.65]
MVSVIFLDVDGVLNRLDGPCLLEATLVRRVARLLSNSDARLVISSTWRAHPKQLAMLWHALAALQVPLHRVLGVTPMGADRVDEITAYLAAMPSPPARWVAIDDLPLALEASHFVRTDPKKGMTLANVHAVLQTLSETTTTTTRTTTDDGDDDDESDTAWRYCLALTTTDDDMGRISVVDAALLDRGKRMVLRRYEAPGTDWKTLFSWVRRVLPLEAFVTVVSSPVALGHCDDPYALLLLLQAVDVSSIAAPAHGTLARRILDDATSKRSLVCPWTQHPSRNFPPVDLVAVVDGLPSEPEVSTSRDVLVRLQLLDTYSGRAVAQHMTRYEVCNGDVRGAMLGLQRSLATWLEAPMYARSVVLAGANVTEWVRACARHGVPATGHTWIDAAIIGTAAITNIFESGSVAATSAHAIEPGTVDAPAADLLELLPARVAASVTPSTRVFWGQAAARILSWTPHHFSRHTLFGYVLRGDIASVASLDAVLACALEDDDLDDLVW